MCDIWVLLPIVWQITTETGEAEGLSWDDLQSRENDNGPGHDADADVDDDDEYYDSDDNDADDEC